MIVSWNWLKEYVALDMSDEVLAHRLMMAGLNHESTSEVDGDLAIDLEVTSNRPDCLGHLGIAREIAVLFSRELRQPIMSFDESAGPIETLTSVDVEPAATSWCPQYRARVIEGVTIGPSPSWMRRRLATLGLPAINNVVDVTNYVLMEMGQPLHAFDLAKLAGKRIVVRSARAGEKFLAINNHTYELKEGMGVIADAERPVAIAGIMGGKETEVTESTQSILLESAEFVPLSIRRTSRALDLSSDSSYRFERKIDPAGVASASDRACHLIAEIAGGKVARGFIHVGPTTYSMPKINLRIDRCSRILGIDLPANRVVEILRSLGCVVEPADASVAHVTPPTFRRDLSREIDLVEEVGRIHGYDQVPQERPIPMVVAPVTRERRVTDKIRSVVLGTGFHEAMTFSFTDAESAGRIRPWTSEEPIVLLHSSRKHENKLRQSLLPSLVETVRLNESRGNEEILLFESAPIYLPAAQEVLPREPAALGLVATRDVRFLRGVVEALFDRLGIAPRFEPFDMVGFEPGASARYLVEGEVVGVIGMVSEKVNKGIDLRAKVSAAELLVSSLVSKAELDRKVVDLPDQPAMIRDLAIVLDEAIPWARLESVARQSAGPLLESLSFVDLYRGKPIEAGHKSIAFRMVFRARGRTLTREEIDGVQQGVISSIDRELGGKIRS